MEHSTCVNCAHLIWGVFNLKRSWNGYLRVNIWIICHSRLKVHWKVSWHSLKEICFYSLLHQESENHSLQKEVTQDIYTHHLDIAKISTHPATQTHALPGEFGHTDHGRLPAHTPGGEGGDKLPGWGPSGGRPGATLSAPEVHHRTTRMSPGPPVTSHKSQWPVTFPATWLSLSYWG